MDKYCLRLLLKDKRLITGDLTLSEFNSEVHLEYNYNDTIVKVNDTFPFSALRKLRTELEKLNYLIVCEGARIDVHPSGMQLDSYCAYILEKDKPASESVFIFDDTDKLDKIVTVQEQEDFYDKWFDSFWPEDN